MAFSMHSHSGQFCPGHAKDDLEVVLQTAIARGMQTFAFTEHMPRIADSDLYPEEVEAGHTIAQLRPRHEAYILEAVRLQEKYKDQIMILIGFEADWIRPSYALIIRELASNPAVDFFIGSVHHVNEIPIDYDASFFEAAVAKAGGTEEKLFEDYFDEQFEMLKALKPRVVGHFDLIRLLSKEKDAGLRAKGGKVWEKVVRNLRVVVESGGLLEINSAGLRKGLKEPYPGRAICEEYLKMGGKFTLSDDSHGVEHLGTNYVRAIEYLESLGVTELYTFERHESASNDGKKELALRSVPVAKVKETFRP